MKLEATDDNVVLKAVLGSGISAGGVVIPGAKTIEDGAEIISVGPNVERLAIGDIVVRPDPPRYEVTDDDTNEIYWLCAEVDILAKFVNEESNAISTAEETEKVKEEETC